MPDAGAIFHAKFVRHATTGDLIGSARSCRDFRDDPHADAALRLRAESPVHYRLWRAGEHVVPMTR
jgi:hypothetical protein